MKHVIEAARAWWGFALLGLFLWAIVFRRLTHATPVVRFVSTVGLWVAIPAWS